MEKSSANVVLLTQALLLHAGVQLRVDNRSTQSGERLVERPASNLKETSSFLSIRNKTYMVNEWNFLSFVLLSYGLWSYDFSLQDAS